MNINYEKKLAIKITLSLFLLLIFSFWIFIYLNYKIALRFEKNIFLNNLSIVPSKYIVNLIEWKKIKLTSKKKLIYNKLFSNFYIKVWNKNFSKWLFKDSFIKNKIILWLKNKEIKVFKVNNEHILAYKIESEDISLVIWKNINYLFISFHRLISISFFISFISIFFLYYLSLKLAYSTTKNIKIANKKLKEYNHNVAHELKTPLAIIKSDLEILEVIWKFDLNIINWSKEEVIYMEEIINNLLFLSENEKIKDKDIILINNEIKIFIKKYFNKSKNLFILDIKNYQKIYFNHKLFDILLKNLLENAIKYRKKWSNIYISFKKNKLVIKNEINKNIKNLDINKVFDVFYKWDDSRNTKGYWLGLNIVKKIINLHNYKIYVKSDNNFFIVTIVVW